MSEVSGTLANSFYQQFSSYPLFQSMKESFISTFRTFGIFLSGLDPSHLSLVAFVFTLIGAAIISYTVLCELLIVLDKQDRLYKQLTLFECNMNRLIKGLNDEKREEIDDSLRYQENKIAVLQEKLNETNETLKVVTYILFKIDEERTERERVEREKNQKQVNDNRCRCDSCMERMEESFVQEEQVKEEQVKEEQVKEERVKEKRVKEKENVWAIETRSSSSEDIEESSDSEEERTSKKSKKVIKKATKTAKKTTKKSSPK